MTELELRNHLVDTLRGWIGRNESDGSHKLIVDTYNSLRPLPRNYKVTYTDAWCAATVSAAAIEAGLTGIIPRECSCNRMIDRFREMGRWMENDAYIPKIGDIIFYDWQDSGKGDCVGASEHVGVVEGLRNGEIVVIEGNYHNAVGRRTVKVDGRYIRGFGVPDYASMSDSPPPPDVVIRPQTNGGRVRAMSNDELAAFLSNPPPLAVGQSWRDWLDAAAQ